MKNDDDFQAKLTRYAHLLFSCASKFDAKANRWRDAGNISAGVVGLSFLYFSVNPNWLFLVVPVIAFFYIRSMFIRSTSKRIFEMIKTAHTMTNGETVDAMYEYIDSRYNKNA